MAAQIVAPDYTVWILLCLVVLVILGAALIIRQRKKNKIVGKIPAEVIAEFNRAEELQKQYKGAVTPQEILWQINEERKNIYTHIKDVPQELRQESDEVQQMQPQQIQAPAPSIKPVFKFNFGNRQPKQW
jgi:hypothetical protein